LGEVGLGVCGGLQRGRIKDSYRNIAERVSEAVLGLLRDDERRTGAFKFAFKDELEPSPLGPYVRV